MDVLLPHHIPTVIFVSNTIFQVLRLHYTSFEVLFSFRYNFLYVVALGTPFQMLIQIYTTRVSKSDVINNSVGG